MAAPLFTLRASHGLDSALTQRGRSLGGVALRDLRRYYEELARARDEAALRSNERDLIAQVLLGTHLESLDPRHLWMELDDTEPEVFAAFGVDREFLVAKIRQCSSMQLRAIVDEVERRFARDGGEAGEQ